MHAWAWWLIIGAAFVVVEILTLDLIFAMLAGGALVAAGAAAIGGGVPLQVGVGIAATVAGLAVLRPVALRHLHTTPELRTGTAALVGREALVLSQVDGRGGQVKLAGEVWSARAMDGTSVFGVGDEVQVLKIDGATALVG
jgi:membrane protein implicated in regulation of membrane protease activity